jgi:hypothetical protein
MESDCKRQKDNCVIHDFSLIELIILKDKMLRKVQNAQVSDPSTSSG